MKRKKNWLCMLFSVVVSFAYTQEKSISGTITDQDGVPLPGVNILVKGTTTGTQSDFDGNYSIVASEGQTLVFSYLGQRTVERTLGNTDTLNVQMQEDASQLEEVVVVGFGTQSKRLLTDNVAKIDSDQIGGIATPSLQNALVAKAPGVQITQINGKLEGGVKVIIRGLSSVSASQEPLYVIDGIEMNNNDISSITSKLNPLLALNPNDIESIDILKDASATAIFGAKGTNGVVLVTTKRGREGKSSISLDVSTSYGKPTNKRDWLNSQQYIELLRESAFNSGAFDFLTQAGTGPR